MRRVLAFGLLLAGCAFPRPLPTSERNVAREIASHFEAVFPPAAGETQAAVGLLRPRFGIPAVVVGAEPFSLVVLARGQSPVRAALIGCDATDTAASACLSGASPASDECIPLGLSAEPSSVLTPTFSLQTYAARPMRPPGEHAYDLAIQATPARLERAPRAVFVRPAAAATAQTLSVVQLSDLHVGRMGEGSLTMERVGRVILAVNALHPDVVVVTGDMAEQGHVPSLEEWAAHALLRIEAPVLAVIGNHDYGHFPRVTKTEEADTGYYNFARVFHAYRFFRTTIAGWDFVGFDSGPSLFSTRILTRGIAPETQHRLRAAIDEAQAAGRGVVLFSHAPTRAALSDDPHDAGSHRLGSMYAGARALERLMLDAGKRGQRVLHLSGHTHWSDLFVGQKDAADFARMPFDGLVCPTGLAAPSLLVNAPSATRISFHTVRHGSNFGFVSLNLSERSSVVQFVLFDAKGNPLGCARPTG